MPEEKADKGWEFLQSDKKEDSYFGEDGSWGYKNADGSAAYFGADGSWGYNEPDGSSSYYGKNGAWGYRNPDGSGAYFGGTTGEDRYYNEVEDKDIQATKNCLRDAGN